MDTLENLLDLAASAGILLSAPSTWWQLVLVAVGLLIALLTSHYLQQRLQPLVAPGRITGLGRTAMRTGVLALIPLLWFSPCWRLRSGCAGVDNRPKSCIWR